MAEHELQPMSDVERLAWRLYCEAAGMGAGAVDHWNQVPQQVQLVYLEKAKYHNDCLHGSHPVVVDILHALGINELKGITGLKLVIEANKIAELTITKEITIGNGAGLTKSFERFNLKEIKK